MFFDLFRKKARVIEVNNGENTAGYTQKNKWIIFAIIVAICFLAFGSCDSQSDETKKAENATPSENYQKYIKSMEAELEEMLTSVKGVGRVKVMLTFETMDEKVLATNRKGNLESEVEEQGSRNKSSDEESVFLFGSGTGEQPYVLKKRLPIPVGVLVTATGAESESVKLEIYESVKALYGISGHRIKVAAAQEK